VLRRQFLASLGAVAALPAMGAESLLRRTWPARWIAVPGADPFDYGVYHFRRTFELGERPREFVVHVSGDNRYQLFVNGIRVVWGPARGDLFHWRYETLDIARWLRDGKNVLAAVVWNFSDQAAEAQIYLESAFLLQGEGDASKWVDSGASWVCERDNGYAPVKVTMAQLHGYYAAGPCDRVDANQHSWGWETVEFDDSQWKKAAVIGPASGREASNAPTRWMLVERPIPLMLEAQETVGEVRRATGIDKPGKLDGTTIPARTHATILIDKTHLTTGHPELVVSGGRDSVIELRYAETLVRNAGGGRRLQKGNRNDIEGKEFIGYNDEFVCDGGAQRTFRPLWWRTWRYLEVDVETKDAPLTVDGLGMTHVRYPFERKAVFDAGSEDIAKLLDVGWRTASLCAHETYMDCPYYEQLQYVGDTRTQCLISIFNTGDVRLVRNAIDLINDSRQSDGATMSRYPSRLEQYIPGFSLWWIGMLHDYWWYVDDAEFVHRMLPGMRAVLSFFEGYQKENGSLKPLPWWRYFDWVPSWQGGDAPQEEDGSSAEFDLLLMMAYGWAADLEAKVGLAGMADVYRKREQQMRRTVQQLYWDSGRRMYADTPRKEKFSQHTNTLAVLAELVTGAAAHDLMLRVLEDTAIAQATFFFRFYVHQALRKVGEGNRYLDLLDDWRGMIANGLTTFAEWEERPNDPPRSDCHAWSASPNVEIFRTVLGVDSMASGFSRVSVRPNLGKLKFARGSVPHPRGVVTVALEPQGSGWSATVGLPAGVTGEFEWLGTRRALTAGENRVRIG
jgi:alpha-L-rhamnosidase